MIAKDPRLMVLGFDSVEQARAAWSLTRRLRRQRVFDLAGGALVWRDDTGAVKVRRLESPPRTAALGGAVCGGVVGAVFFAPVIGLGLGAGIGALISRFLGPGMDEAQVRRVARHLQPGRAAVFTLALRSADELVAALRPHQPTVIMALAPAGRERRLVHAHGRRAAPA
ncbi:hypothetical protein FAIPA1_30189 [Frankia sp. AiPs1]|uniref:DUF1269 domain-containing protein n=1 Tax=Frankia sp. AiPa1 TaxID=573492 RepID=UPI00202B029A|nr:DUF1269 domain-containing protein [Frankia sp. AiPa1]MCL9759908.1 DUF1269 domain-containing protein [Frankia sp. AiPa1]